MSGIQATNLLLRLLLRKRSVAERNSPNDQQFLARFRCLHFIKKLKKKKKSWNLFLKVCDKYLSFEHFEQELCGNW
jgi:hypothetical protein